MMDKVKVLDDQRDTPFFSFSCGKGAMTMMTGQVIAGADPVAASAYQIVVMLMVASATALGAVLSVLLSFGKRFTDDGVYLERGLRDDAR